MAAYTVDKSPADEFSLENKAVVGSSTFPYAKITVPGVMEDCYLTLATSVMGPGKVGLSGMQV